MGQQLFSSSSSSSRAGGKTGPGVMETISQLALALFFQVNWDFYPKTLREIEVNRLLRLIGM